MEIRRRPPKPTVRVEKLEYAVPHREAQAKNILEEWSDSNVERKEAHTAWR